MEDAVSPVAFKEALIILAAAGVVVPLFQRLRASPVLGFMLVGMAVGPYGLGRLTGRMPFLAAVTIPDAHAIAPIAELGVVLLLFMIGLELSFERLWLMRRLVFGLGTLQLVLGGAALAGIARMLGAAPHIAIVLGMAWAMSSTAVVVQVLSEERRLGTATGRASFAVLLFQDLAVVPALFALGTMAPNGPAVSAGGFALAVGQAALAVVAILALGRLALRPLFRSVARTQSPESFMAACLLVVIVTALITGAAGLSMALGALIGGLLLAGTEYRRQVEVTIEPFKGLLVGVFLISVGLSLDVRLLAAQPLVILGTVCVMVLVKLATIALPARGFGLPWRACVQTGLLLGPSGEFGFVILTLAAGRGLLPPQVAEPAMFVTALSMAAIPALSWLGRRLLPEPARPRGIDPALLPPDRQGAPGPRADGAKAPVILAGFGRVGQTVAIMLEAFGLPYVAIDRAVDRVAALRAEGKPVFYGNIASRGLLRRLGIDTARALVVTLDDRRAVDEVVAAARQIRPGLPIICRARDAGHAAHLYREGATEAVPETVEASLQLAEAVLVDLGCPMGPVIAAIHERRAAVQASIRALAPEAEIRPRGRRSATDVRITGT